TLRREQALSEVRADFLAAVSHELRTPLAQIRMFAELLRSGAMRKPDEMSRALNVIEKESSRLSILVDNVLNYARLRRESSPVSVEVSHGTDVKRDIDYVIDAFAPLAREKEVSLTSSAADSVPFANVDSEAVRQILLNFLENAVKYGPRDQTVAIGAAQHGARVQVWVDDQGPGVSPTEREFIWTAFRRGKAGSESRTGGAGIGLSVVHDLVKEYGGNVWVEDSATGGARFMVEFDAVAGKAS
ncbi:MAG: HAMP domain-containing sensor histidine kinase, partial [Gemmatimonas sp.]